MLNQLVLVGRLVNIKTEKTENGENKTIVNLAVPQAFKNANGEYETNFIDCFLFGNVAKNVIEWCKKGDLLGIKGRIQRLDNNEAIEIYADRVTFLSSGKQKENGDK